MINVAYIPSYPFCLQFGGMEIQMLTYYKYVNEMLRDSVKIQLLDIWKKEILNEFAVLHLFGLSNWHCDLTRVLKANHPEKRIVISPTFYCANENVMALAAKIAKMLPIPNFFSYKKLTLSNCDSIIVNSNAEKEQIRKIFGIAEDKFNIINNFVESNFSRFNDNDNKDEFIVKYNLEKGYLLCVGFMDDRKNTLSLVRAYLEICNAVKKKLVLIGDYRFRKNSDNEELRKLIDNHKDKICHIPYINRGSVLLKSAYQNCAAHVLPSILETPGITNLEAASFGKPILVGDCKPVREYFGEYAVYCTPNNLASIKGGIIKVSINYADKKLVELVREKYNENIIIPKLGEIYTQS